MPHQCTNCEATFPDGSKEMLSGCPHCGGNTFQYIPEGADPERTETDDPPEPPLSEDSVAGRVGRAASTVKEYVSDRGGKSTDPGAADTADPEPTRETQSDSTRETQPEPSPETQSDSTAGRDLDPDDAEVVASETDTATAETPEDSAQASARGEVADLSELSAGSGTEPSTAGEPAPDPGADTAQPPGEGRVAKEPDAAADTDLDTLREELNDQFESIRIVEPGQYELNLMELYDREEHIVALREDGKYVIEVPETWRED